MNKTRFTRKYNENTFWNITPLRRFASVQMLLFSPIFLPLKHARQTALFFCKYRTREIVGSSPKSINRLLSSERPPCPPKVEDTGESHSLASHSWRGRLMIGTVRRRILCFGCCCFRFYLSLVHLLMKPSELQSHTIGLPHFHCSLPYPTDAKIQVR